MAHIVEAAFDRFNPKRSKLSDHDNIVLDADASMLAHIEIWARSARETLQHDARPLSREKRAKAMEISAIAFGFPKLDNG